MALISGHAISKQIDIYQGFLNKKLDLFDTLGLEAFSMCDLIRRLRYIIKGGDIALCDSAVIKINELMCLLLVAIKENESDIVDDKGKIKAQTSAKN